MGRLLAAMLAVPALWLAFLAQPAQPASRGTVIRVHVTGVIGQAVQDYVKRGIRRAEDTRARALLITIDTPGGLLESTKNICGAMQNTRTPVIVYVSPNGATATSAGFFLLQCSDVAAMAPDTSTGSAHPVSTQGQMDRTMKEKVTNYSVSYMKTLTERRNRNTAFAEKAIRHSKSITAKDALEEHVVEIVAANTTDMLAKAHGMSFKKGGKKITVRTKGALVEDMEMSLREKFIHTVGHPNIAYIFFIVGIYALIFEVTHPGTYVSGAIGVISLVIAFVAFSVLPINSIGILLIVAGMGLFLLEIKIVSHGLLTAGGIVLFVIGSLFLIDSAEGAMRVNISLIISVAASMAALIVLVLAFVIKSLKKSVATGAEAMAGKKGVVKKALDPEGKVLVHGELWNARTAHNQHLEAGTRVQVTSLDGMEIIVKPLE